MLVCLLLFSCVFFFFKQKTAYEMRISDWSSDVCSSDLIEICSAGTGALVGFPADPMAIEVAVDHGLDISAHRAQQATLPLLSAMDLVRSEESRVGKECVSTCRSRWSPYH